MKKNCRAAAAILAVYLLATAALLFLGYGIAAPAVERQEFPFSVTYTYEGREDTVTGTYVAEFSRGPKRIGESAAGWYGYIKDQNRLDEGYLRVRESDEATFFITLNLIPGYLMGDEAYADAVCEPEASYILHTDGDGEEIRDEAALRELGIGIVSWEYPHPVENSFSFGGISLSGQASLVTSAAAFFALLACVFLLKKERAYTKADKISMALNFLLALLAFPFILIVAVLSEMLDGYSLAQQVMYLAPALTMAGIAASVALRRLGRSAGSFAVQFIGPLAFAFVFLAEALG